MKKFLKLLLCVALISSIVSCDKDDNKEEENNDVLYQQILTNFVDKTVVPTYKAMAEAALEMRTANEALKANPTDANMQAASEAWMKARIWWEMNEAFLFGPVGEDALDVDGHVDSWPLELNDITAKIQEIRNGGNITGAQAWRFESDIIGFHATEYLLYNGGTTRPVADLDVAELNYLTTVTDALVWDCVLAYVAWVGVDNVSAEMKSVFNENPDIAAHLDDNPAYKNYAAKLKNATDFPTGIVGALELIPDGAMTIAAEVGQEKITSPYEERAPAKVESWYSWHCIDDFKNNMLSIQNAYLGGVDNNSRTTPSLSTFVKSVDSQLDTDIKNKITDCIAKIEAMGTGGKSFYEVVRDQINTSQVEAAANACDELSVLFEKVIVDIIR